MKKELEYPNGVVRSSKTLKDFVSRPYLHYLLSDSNGLMECIGIARTAASKPRFEGYMWPRCFLQVTPEAILIFKKKIESPCIKNFNVSYAKLNPILKGIGPWQKVALWRPLV